MTKLDYYFNKMKVNMIVTLQNTCYLYKFGHDYWHMDCFQSCYFLRAVYCIANITLTGLVPQKKEMLIKNRTKKFASSRRRGRLTRSQLCCGEDAWSLCRGATTAEFAYCLPEEYQSSRKIKSITKVIKYCNSV